jgi:rhodanese-related sulfurtransferase
MASDSTPLLPEVTFITPEALKTRLEAGEYLCVIDARDLMAFDLGHIPGAQWCTCSLWESQIERQAPTRYVPLVVYCSQGEEAPLSVPILRHLGYAHVCVVQGGFVAWCAAGFPVEAMVNGEQKASRHHAGTGNSHP